jgi:hypothetical protein
MTSCLTLSPLYILNCLMNILDWVWSLVNVSGAGSRSWPVSAAAAAAMSAGLHGMDL